MIRKIKFTNANGDSIKSDNKIIFCEKINTTGLSGRFITESSAFGDGQTTVSYKSEPRTIPVSFAVKVLPNQPHLLDKILDVFTVLTVGTLTVENDRGDTFEIDCYPEAVPNFEIDSVKYVYRFNVSFIADNPYWRRLPKHTFEAIGDITRSNDGTGIMVYSWTYEFDCKSTVPTYPIITVPKNMFMQNSDTDYQNTLTITNSHGSGKLYIETGKPQHIIDTKKMTVNGSYKDFSKIVTGSFENLYFTKGKNTITARSQNVINNSPLTVEYYDLFGGVV